jgi:hypothetical protein
MWPFGSDMWMPTHTTAVGRVACERTTLQGEHGISIQPSWDMFYSWICAEGIEDRISIPPQLIHRLS